MKFIYPFTLAFLYSSFCCFAQNEVQQLERIIQNSSGIQKADAFNRLSELYLKSSLDTALLYSEMALEESRKSDYTPGIAKSLLNRASALEVLGKYEESKADCEQSLELYQSLDDPGGIAEAHNIMGIIYLTQSQFETASKYFNLSLEMFLRQDNKEGINRIYKSLGNLKMMEGNYDEALQWYLKGSEISLEVGNDQNTSGFYTNIGVIYQNQGHYDKALEYYFMSLALKEKLQDKKGEAAVFNNIGLLYSEMENYDKALEYHRKCLQTDREMGATVEITMDLNNIGNVYLNQRKLDSALHFFQESLAMRENLGRKRDIAHSLVNIGRVYLEKAEYDKAQEAYLKAVKMNEELNDKKRASANYIELGALYTRTGRYREAEEYLKKGLTIREEIGDYYGTRLALDALYILYDSLRDYRQSLYYYKKSMAVKDSLSSEEKHRQIVELQTRYETEKKEKEIASLQFENELSAFWQKTYGAGLLLTVFLGVGFVMLYRYRHRKNQQLLEIQRLQTQQLQEIDRLKSRFFANISHEFRTPLTLILAPVESLLSEIKEEENREKLRTLQRNAQRLLKLINQMLDLSRLESGKLELRASLNNIVPFLKGLFFSFNSLAEKKQIGLEFTCDEEEIHLFYDAEKLEQVVANLLSNAFKFTPDGGNITLSIRRIHKENRDFLAIQVSDTGMGISSDQLPYIFDRFFQVDNSDTKEQEGSGIGLALAKELVLLHHGEISAESEKGKGTVFNVHLPFGKEHLRNEEMALVAPAQPAFAVKEEAPIVSHSGNPVAQENTDQPLILVVEDHPDLREYLNASLIREYRVTHASNGKEGLEMALEMAPDLIVSDVMMPKMNGLEMCKILKSDLRTSHIPIILLTAKVEEEDKITGLESKADDYLTKPFRTRELLTRIKNLIELRKTLREKFKTGLRIRPQEIEVSSMEKVFLEKLLMLLEENIGNEHFGVEQLSAEMGMSRVHLHRKMQALTNHSPSEFIRSFRLQRAMDLLRKNAGTIAEIAEAVGFASSTYFSKCFSDEFGYPPKEVRTRSS